MTASLCNFNFNRLGNEIEFAQVLPDLSEDLREIDPKFNNVLVFDDLMSQATDSPLLSLLFTQGRYCNASMILLLQNMFPKGKFNTEISRNAHYMVLFRSPSGRKQIDVIAERIFAKDRPNFMSAYAKETERPYGYLLIDNQPKTPAEKQVLANVFENCQAYPHITSSTQPILEISRDTPVTGSRCIKHSEVKQQKPFASTKKSYVARKPKVDFKTPPAKKKRKVNTKPVKNKRTNKRQPNIYKSKWTTLLRRESFEADEFSSEEDTLNGRTQSGFSFEEDLNDIATRDYQANRRL